MVSLLVRITSPSLALLSAPTTQIQPLTLPKGSYITAADAPYAQRALPPSNLDTQQDAPDYPYNYHIYTVLKRLDVLGGPIAPWFDQPGLSVQFFTGSIGNVRTLIARGYLARNNVTNIIPGPGRANKCG